MSLSIYDASVPVFVTMLTNMRNWLDKIADKPDLIDARLAPDMRPLSAQYQMASDSAKNAIARLAGIDAPAMPDTEASLADLKARCDKTIAFINGIECEQLDAAATRPVELKFPNNMGYRFEGQAYLTGFALPNFLFHATTAYAILRAQGVEIGKADFLAHLGAPVTFEAA